jgi:hypothetical protein
MKFGPIGAGAVALAFAREAPLSDARPPLYADAPGSRGGPFSPPGPARAGHLAT